MVLNFFKHYLTICLGFEYNVSSKTNDTSISIKYHFEWNLKYYYHVIWICNEIAYLYLVIEVQSRHN